MKYIFILLLLNSVNLLAQNKCSHKNTKNTLKTSAQYNLRSDTFNILKYNIQLDLTQLAIQELSASCKINFETLKDNQDELRLDLLSLNVDSVTHLSGTLSFNYNDTLLIIHLPALLDSLDQDSLTVYYHGTPVKDASGFGGFYFQNNYAFNLGVGFSAEPHNYGRVWHPCIDNFVERAKYSYTITTPLSLSGYANGTLVNESLNATTRTRAYELTEEIPTYLAAVSVANYTSVHQEYQSLFGPTIPITLTAAPNDTSNLKGSFVNLHGAMTAFETAFGPYLWSSLGYYLVPFNGGAMEHATNIAYPKATVNGSTTYETLMAHELAHHWWGNLVTCRTAEEMWINEGMASYCERLFLEHVYNYDRYLSDVKANHKSVLLSAHINDGGYYSVSGVPHNITYGDHSYNKGADVAHNLRTYMSDSLFFPVLTNFLEDNIFKDVSAADIMQYINDSSSANVTDYFTDWIYNAGYPSFYIDSFQVNNNSATYDVTLFIKQKLKGTTHLYNNVPLTVTLVDSDGNEYSDQITVGGANSIININSAINPEWLYLNGDDKLSMAVTGELLTITTNGTKDLNYPMFRFSTQQVQDSTTIRLDHYWTSPDPIKEPTNQWLYKLSQDRFWQIQGIDNSDFIAEGKVFFNAKNNSSGNLDLSLFNISNFHEDSLALLYRRNAADDWEVVPNYEVNTLGSPSDGLASIEWPMLMNGEYAFAIKQSTLSVESEKQLDLELKLHPVPVLDYLTIQTNVPFNESVNIIITALDGKMILNQPYFKDTWDLKKLPKGAYILTLETATNKISKIFTKL